MTDVSTIDLVVEIIECHVLLVKSSILQVKPYEVIQERLLQLSLLLGITLPERSDTGGNMCPLIFGQSSRKIGECLDSPSKSIAVLQDHPLICQCSCR